VLALLLVFAPLMAAQSIAQIQSLQGQVWVQRDNEKIALNTESEIHTGDSISTSESARLVVQLWSQLKLKLDANSEIAIIPGAKDKPGAVATIQKFIKLEYGSGCIDIGHVADSGILLQLATRVSLTLRRPAELCLSSNADETHIQLISGSVEVLQAASSMLIALNQPGSEIRFFDDGDYKLQTPSSATETQVIPQLGVNDAWITRQSPEK
jgi:hypothetical protein